MSSVWWSLPGPSRFLNKVCDDLTDGKMVFLQLPANPPRRIKTYLKERWLEHDLYEWRELKLQYMNMESGHPAKLLYDIHLPDTPSEVLRNAANLARDPAFGNMIIWVEGLTETLWSAWNEFLYEYAETVRNRPPEERTRFVVLLEGEIASRNPPTAPAISVRDWKGTVDRLDMMLYCSSLLGSRPLSTFQQRLAAELIASLAMWDHNLADYLIDLPLADLLDPAATLIEFAREMQWDDTMKSSWSAGTVNEFERRMQPHSAYLAVTGRDPAIRRRIWQAQLSVLYPAMEELRHALIEFFGDLLVVPFTDQWERVIEDRLDLEIGHIRYQVKYHPKVDRDLKEAVERLWELRNLLAHLDPVPKDRMDLIENIEFLFERLSSSS